ncbi:MAG: hypothetical protein C0621_10265 [Desulfuromonas sp.]|nr:MAG: hypothetical protein C0621_10265 [Desulfuromonas sp.]
MEIPKKILLVDDVKLFLDMERSFLNRERVQVTTATSGEEALKILRATRQHLVLMDHLMPGLDGASCCRQIKQDPALFTTPVVLITDGLPPEEVELCRGSGCDDIIQKPLNRSLLLEVVRRFLKLADRATPRVKSRMLVHYGLKERKTLHDYSVNLSAGGLFIETRVPLPLESIITLEFFLPGAEKTVCCKGKIVWINAEGSPFNPALPPGLGIEFLDLCRHDERRIQEFVLGECLGEPLA